MSSGDEQDNWNPSPRRWIAVGDSCEDQLSFSAITYNILNDFYVIDSPDYAVYLKDDTAHLKCSKVRNTRILKELALWDPDIVALQEMRRDLYCSQFLPEMATRGYSGLLATPLHIGPGHCNVALFFRSEIFDLQRAICGPLDDLITSHFGPAAEAQLELLRHPRGPEYSAVIAKLLHRPSGRSIVVGSFHLTWEEFKAPVFKSLQATAIAHHAERMARESNDQPCPLLLLGDFNSTPGQMTYELLAEDRWSGDVLSGPEVARDRRSLEKFVKDNCRLPAGLKLRSCYKEATGQEPLITSLSFEHGVCQADCLDYIWRSESRGMALTGVMSECSESELRRFQALPSPLFPSDHVPVMAKLRLQKLP